MRILSLPLVVILASCAATSHVGDASKAKVVIERVFDTFNSCNIDSLVANYSDNNIVFFTPGTPKALRSRAELRKYFSYFDSEPCSSPRSAKHTNVALHVRPLGLTAAIIHATTIVKYEDKGKPVSFPFYFTFVLQWQDDQWLVISQNAQPVPKE